MTFIEMQGVFLVLFFLNEIQVSFRVPVLLSFPFARNFKHHCLSVSSRHVKVWNRSAVFTMLQRASTLSDISCLFLLIKVSFPLQNQDAGAKKDKRAKNIQDAHFHVHNLTFHNKQYKGTDIFYIVGLRLLDL